MKNLPIFVTFLVIIVTVILLFNVFDGSRDADRSYMVALPIIFIAFKVIKHYTSKKDLALIVSWVPILATILSVRKWTITEWQSTDLNDWVIYAMIITAVILITITVYHHILNKDSEILKWEQEFSVQWLWLNFWSIISSIISIIAIVAISFDVFLFNWVFGILYGLSILLALLAWWLTYWSIILIITMGAISFNVFIFNWDQEEFLFVIANILPILLVLLISRLISRLVKFFYLKYFKNKPNSIDKTTSDPTK